MTKNRSKRLAYALTFSIAAGCLLSSAHGAAQSKDSMAAELQQLGKEVEALNTNIDSLLKKADTVLASLSTDPDSANKVVSDQFRQYRSVFDGVLTRTSSNGDVMLRWKQLIDALNLRKSQLESKPSPTSKNELSDIDRQIKGLENDINQLKEVNMVASVAFNRLFEHELFIREKINSTRGGVIDVDMLRSEFKKVIDSLRGAADKANKAVLGITGGT